MKNIIISLFIGIAVGILGCIVYLDGKDKSFGMVADIYPLGSSISSSVEIGPQEDNRVVASTTNRVYLSIQSLGNGNVPVYCEANSDAPATASEGIGLATSTNMLYEYTPQKGNLFAGSLRCTATASTTVLIQQFIGK